VLIEFMNSQTVSLEERYLIPCVYLCASVVYYNVLFHNDIVRTERKLNASVYRKTKAIISINIF